jgi:BspA type Leucine rich repeat region (6 copies)
MKMIITPHPSMKDADDKLKEDAVAFLESLNIKNNQHMCTTWHFFKRSVLFWRMRELKNSLWEPYTKVQEYEFENNSSFKIFGMDFSPSLEDVGDGWTWRFEADEEAERFYLGEKLIAAAFLNDRSGMVGFDEMNVHAGGPLGNNYPPCISFRNNHEITCVPPALIQLGNLTGLSLEGCSSLTDLSALRELRQLTSLNLAGCKKLTDLSVLRDLSQLTSLNLAGCEKLTDLSVLRDLSQLTSLNLAGCEKLTDLSALRELKQLTSLNLTGYNKLTAEEYRPLTDLSVLSALSQLTSLNLTGCNGWDDLGKLSGLVNLTSLSLEDWRSFQTDLDFSQLVNLTSLSLRRYSPPTRLDLSSLVNLTSLSLEGQHSLPDLSGLVNLTALSLEGCEHLHDINLSGLVNLTSLSLAGCEYLHDLNLTGLENLTDLNLVGCDHLFHLGDLNGLVRLTSLNLVGCEHLLHLGELSGLVNLTSLNLVWCRSLTDLNLSGLVGLTSLNLAWGKSLHNLNLSGLVKLTSLNLFENKSLTNLDLSGLVNLISLRLIESKSLTSLNMGGLKNLTSTNLGLRNSRFLTNLNLGESVDLTSLDLEGCSSLTDLSGLSGLKRLTSLNLERCSSLTDLSGLSGLKRLTSLDLDGCSSLTDLSGLSGLKRLTSLDLRGCWDIRTLLPLKSLRSLETLVISSSRVLSIEPLRDIATLRQVTSFNPPEVAELLAHTAVLRADGEFISMSAGDWLGEAKNWVEGSIPLRTGFASTLGKAFSLLGKNAIELPYEEYLQSSAEFSSAPWKAWFEGTRMASGQELMWMRIRRQNIDGSTPGCIGGICSVLVGEGAAPEEVKRSQDWLNSMEECWNPRSKELLPVSAEICLVYARLGEWEALGRWLVRFTDSSDPSALDPVQASLAGFQMDRDDLVAAEDHIFAVHASQTRDDLLLEFVGKLGASDPEKSSLFLLLVKDPVARAQMGQRLLAKEGIEISEITRHRLIVAMDANPIALAGLISKLLEFPDQPLIEKISKALQFDSIALFTKLATELKEEAERYRNMVI